MKKMAKPLCKFSAGQVVAAVWENKIPGRNGEVDILKATVQRRYKDKSGEWKSSSSFSRNEIPLVIYTLGKAFEAMIDEKNSSIEEEIVM